MDLLLRDFLTLNGLNMNLCVDVDNSIENMLITLKTIVDLINKLVRRKGVLQYYCFVVRGWTSFNYRPVLWKHFYIYSVYLASNIDYFYITKNRRNKTVNTQLAIESQNVSFSTT